MFVSRFVIVGESERRSRSGIEPKMLGQAKCLILALFFLVLYSAVNQLNNSFFGANPLTASFKRTHCFQQGNQ